MAVRSLYMGPRLKAVRRDMGLTQANMAADLDISPSYIALMERNQRPVTAELLLKLAATYKVDIVRLAEDDSEEIAARLQSVLADPLFADIDLPVLDLADISVSYPGIAEAILRLHTALTERQLALAERNAAGLDGLDSARQAADEPVVEARAFLAARHNYFPDLDDSAAKLAGELPDLASMEARIAKRHGLEVRYADAALLLGAVRWHDYHQRRIMLADQLDYAARRFQLALQLAILEQGALIDQIATATPPSGENAQQMVRHALQSYWAAALLMPYGVFYKAATDLRYDLELLAARFMVSVEQVAHRLTTLQREDAAGVPFFFLRMDQAGNVSKRLDGASFPFARAAGGCPLWNVHKVFSNRGTANAQLIELPDGQRFISLARTVESSRRAFGEERALRAIVLVCKQEHQGRLVYGDHLHEGDAVPIGISCRLCHRPRCVARALPPLGRNIMPNRFRDPGVPFPFSGD